MGQDLFGDDVWCSGASCRYGGVLMQVADCVCYPGRKVYPVDTFSLTLYRHEVARFIHLLKLSDA